MNIRTPLAAVAAAAVALGLGSARAPLASAVAAPPQHHSCFWGHDVDSFSATPDQRTVYLRVGVQQYYQLRLFAPCQDINWDHGIALVARGGGDWICTGSGLDAEVIAHATGLGRQTCQVSGVRKLTPAEVSAIPKGYRP
ncbi:MAG TPA: DUF6491 family protein [Caulobacteraceae bacterium]|nr:DUF6491 family protein [Caulobacteraceae bacterium]